MASLQLRNVNDEKADAMRRFHRKQKLENIWHLFNVSAALLFFSRSSWFPIAVQAFRYFYAQLLPLFNNSFYAFLLGNAILLVVYALSNTNGASSDVYDEFINHSESRLKITAPVAGNNPEEFTLEKQNGTVESSDCSEVGESPVFDETVSAVNETTMTRTCCTTVSRTRTRTRTRTRATNGDKVSEKKCYRRVPSESFERLVVVAPRRELKNLNTGLSRELQRRLCYVEELSKEEFNRTVEDFIAKHKRMLREEQREL